MLRKVCCAVQLKARKSNDFDKTFTLTTPSLNLNRLLGMYENHQYNQPTAISIQNNGVLLVVKWCFCLVC